VRQRWSAQAIEDRLGIFDYIASDSGHAALEVDEAIEARVNALLAMPRSGRPGRLANTREAVIGGTPYIVVYKVSDAELHVIRVLHSAQQWPPAR